MPNSERIREQAIQCRTRWFHTCEASLFRSCHTKVTLKILTLRRALRQAEEYEISQIWP